MFEFQLIYSIKYKILSILIFSCNENTDECEDYWYRNNCTYYIIGIEFGECQRNKLHRVTKILRRLEILFSVRHVSKQRLNEMKYEWGDGI